ncbi:Putative DNA-binding domain-containing protein [Alteromonadaceae bacterium Bs31]|nr:Putative DNA-binding domain-containing protein [Alteromonadaceae bacterium Bs31]
MRLDKTQSSFARFLKNGSCSFELEKALKDYPREELDDRLNIYRNNVFHSMTEVLQDTFSSVASVVGDDFFEALATAFIKSSPPSQPAMIHFGENFPNFIENFEHSRQLPYLADLARLEWAEHSAYYKAEAQALPLESFTSLSNTELANAIFTFHPSFHLLRSSYAIFSITEMLRSEEIAETTNYQHSENVLIIRPESVVKRYKLSNALSHFFELLVSRVDLETALDEAQLVANTLKDESFNPSEAVAFLINSQSVIAVA